MDTTQSEKTFERLARVLPGANTRTATYYDPCPVALSGGSGFLIWDVDGNEYLDFLNNYTALVHGNAHPAITAVLKDHLERGTVFPSPMEVQAELAERIVSRFASVERVRFCNSGTEAVMTAVRVARAFTGREKIVMAVGAYHGAWEQVSSAEERVSGGQPRSSHVPGIPRSVADMVRWVNYNDIQQLQSVMAADRDSIAAILLEPVLGHVVEPGDAEFIRTAKTLASESGALLILDEVVTARLALGGYQSLIDVKPDVTTFGKIIGGGLPIGAVGGRGDVMDLFDPRRDDAVVHHGTFNGNVLSMVAGCASLDLLTQSEIDRINGLGAALEGALHKVFSSSGLDVEITRAGSILNLHSTHLPRLHLAALRNGLYFAPRGQMSISTPMDDATVNDAVARLQEAVRIVDVAEEVHA